jgi:Bacterial Ig domain
LFSDITATSIVAIALTALLLSSSPLPSSFSFHTNTNRDHLAFASLSISGPQTTVQVPLSPPSSSHPQYPTLDTESTQSSQSQSVEGSGPSSDNFNLPAGYIIEPFLENLSMPTSIALDSENGTIYVAESINEHDNNDNSSILTSISSPPPGSFLSQQPQVRIVKAEISGETDRMVNQTLDRSIGGISDTDNDNSSTIIHTDLKWPVIDIEVDDTTRLLYALHDRTTISTINTTSGERADILAREEVEQPAAGAGSDEYEEVEQQDPLSFLINSSSQIVLSGNEDYYDSLRDRGEAVSNPDSYNFPTMLYTPCMNDDTDNNNYGIYCILGLPIDRNGNSAIVDNIGSINSSSSFILENMTSRPVGIAILNSSSHAATSSSSSSPYSSSPSTSSVSEQQSPYALTGSQTSNAFFNNSENDLLIIASQPPSNISIFSNTNNDNNNEQNRSSYGSSSSSNYLSDAALSSLNTIYHTKVFDSIPYPVNSSNDLQDTINNNNNYGDSSNHNPRQQAQPPSMEVLAAYPYGQLGQVAVVSVPSTTATISSSSSSADETTETNQTTSIEEDNLSAYSPLPFGLNKTMAFIADFGNSSAYGAAALNLPKIIMLDVQTGNITPFLALKHYDPSFTPIDIAFDYNNSALYVLSTGNNQEEDTSNNNNTPTLNDTHNSLNTGSLNNKSNGIIWKISYQGEEQEAATGSNSSSINNSTDNNYNDSDNATSSLTTPPPSSSSNDTDSSDNSTDSSSEDSNGLDDESSSYYEDEDDTDDDSIGTDNNSSSNSEEDTENNSEGSASSAPPPSDSSSQDTTTPPDASSTTPPASPPTDEQSPVPPSTTQPPPSSKVPDNEAPVANDQRIEIEEDSPSVDVELTAADNNYEDLQNLEFTIVSDPAHGVLGEIRQEEASSGDSGSDDSQAAKATVTYTPDENYNGQDSFQFRVNDEGKADSNTATVTINITPVNDAPTAEDDAATTDQNIPVLVDVLANDVDIDEESNNGDDSFTIDSVDEQSAQGGSISRVNTGSESDGNNDDAGRGTHNEKAEYTPAEGFSGTDKFTYTIVDSNGATESATVTVIVKQVVAETEELPNGALEDGEGKGDNDND